MTSTTMEVEVHVDRLWITRTAITVAQFMPESWRLPLATWAVGQSRPKFRIGDGKWRPMGRVDLRGFDPDTGDFITYMHLPEDHQ